MTNINSDVLNEYFKIAEKSDLLGLKKEAAPAKNKYQEDKKTIEEKRLETKEKSIIEEAHPEPVFVAESRGEGGLVENQIEQQKRMIEVINKMPTGSLVARYASAINEIVKLAEECDENEDLDTADLLIDLASKLVSDLDKPLPF